MITRNIILAGSALVFALPVAAQARPHHSDYQTAQKVEVVQRGAHGRAESVMIGGERYAVCSMTRQDNCINPRAAKLGWGNRPLDYWPGHPASQHVNRS